MSETVLRLEKAAVEQVKMSETVGCRPGKDETDSSQTRESGCRAGVRQYAVEQVECCQFSD